QKRLDRQRPAPGKRPDQSYLEPGDGGRPCVGTSVRAKRGGSGLTTPVAASGVVHAPQPAGGRRAGVVEPPERGGARHEKAVGVGFVDVRITPRVVHQVAVEDSGHGAIWRDPHVTILALVSSRPSAGRREFETIFRIFQIY